MRSRSLSLVTSLNSAAGDFVTTRAGIVLAVISNHLGFVLVVLLLLSSYNVAILCRLEATSSGADVGVNWHAGVNQRWTVGVQDDCPGSVGLEVLLVRCLSSVLLAIV